MTEETKITEEITSYKYDAFISYSRKNQAFAQKLEQSLENYKPEKSLSVPQRHIEIFRDHEDFTGGDYHKSLQKNLMDSSKLIVICSPEARASQYVNDEIKRFIDARGPECVIPILFSGIPNNEAKAGQEAEMAFPVELCNAIEIPLAVNFLGFDAARDKINKGIFTSSWYTVLADIYGLSRSEMEQREKRRRARSRRIALGVLSGSMMILTMLLIFALVSRSQAVSAREAEREQKEVAENAKKEADVQRDDAIKARNETKSALDRETDARNLAEEKRKEAEEATKNERIAKDQAEEGVSRRNWPRKMKE
jgi:hypothetical protein